MSLDKYLPEIPSPPAAAYRVSISPYVNEPLPNWAEFLSAHDVARLTRRPRWLLAGMTIIGRFPRKQQFRGRSIGWRRSQIYDWMASERAAVSPCKQFRWRRRQRARGRRPIHRHPIFGFPPIEPNLFLKCAHQRLQRLRNRTRLPRG